MNKIIEYLLKRRKLVIAVDFDGTIVTNGWPGIGKPRWFALPVLRWLKKRGHTLILWTNREVTSLWHAQAYLHYNGFYFDYYNENCRELLKVKDYRDTRKIGAHLYIDDLGAGFWIWPMIPVIVWLKERGV